MRRGNAALLGFVFFVVVLAISELLDDFSVRGTAVVAALAGGGLALLFMAIDRRSRANRIEKPER